MLDQSNQNQDDDRLLNGTHNGSTDKVEGEMKDLEEEFFGKDGGDGPNAPGMGKNVSKT